ncbi:MAG: FxsA family protein [Pseudomonadales bacterium]|nr:FxsA family protein [Pseudomonadales bacterium]
MRILLPLFIALPILEMFILIRVGGIIGALPTIALVVLTATIGLWLLKREGLATLNRVQTRVSQGELPETELLEGIMLIVGGALLLTPGFVTDAIGFACLLPFLRQPIARWLVQRAIVIKTRGSGGGSQYRKETHIIEGEFTEEDKNK